MKIKSAIRNRAAQGRAGQPGARRRVARVPKNKPAARGRELLLVGQLRAEKCELLEARESYFEAKKISQASGDLRGVMEAIAGLLRLAGEAQDKAAIERWHRELDVLMEKHPRQVPPMAWYCKGMIAHFQERYRLAQRHFHRYLKAVRAAEESRGPEAACVGVGDSEECLAKGWLMIAYNFWHNGKPRRAEWLAQKMLSRYESRGYHSVVGSACILIGRGAEKRQEFDEALRWLQKAHGIFLAVHNWYQHLWVLYGYARLLRIRQSYSQAYWHLDLIDKAANGPEFGRLRAQVQAERSRLEQDAVDLLIDSRRGLVKTRENGAISLRKQYVLLNILEALSQAHGREGADVVRGLSKAEIIECVWHEKYRPEAHDNKLYYNINRLRKLIEPDMRKPQYLLNWKEGYRLAPGLRVQLIGNLKRLQSSVNE